MAGTPNTSTEDISLNGMHPVGGPRVGLNTKAFPIVLAGLSGTNKVVSNYQFGCNGRVVATRYIPTIPATTASKAATITPTLDDVALGAASGSGGALALTTANSGADDPPVSGTAITGTNTFSATTNFDLTLSSVTAFAEGSGVIEVDWYDDDLRDLLSTMGVLFAA
jgi:hypothetical protein